MPSFTEWFSTPRTSILWPRWHRKRKEHSTQRAEPTSPDSLPEPSQVSSQATVATPVTGLPRHSNTGALSGVVQKPQKSSKSPKSKYGLFQLNESPDDGNRPDDIFPVDIVAVHGITGGAYSTWTHKDGAFWLGEFLPSQFPGTRVFSYGYPAEIFFSREKGDINSFARNLLEKLKRERSLQEFQHRPIVFICHSMGGIVVKQALITAKIDSEAYNSILSSVTGVLFFATPHRGADSARLLEGLASIANLPSKGIRFIPSIRSSLIKPLRKESKALKDISINFRQLIPDLRIASFIEKKAMVGKHNLIVDENTGIMDDLREQIISMDGRDHSTICKFSDEEDEEYKDVLNVLREYVSQATNNRLDEFNSEDLRKMPSSRKPENVELTSTACLKSFEYLEMTFRRHDADRAHPNTCDWILKHPSFTTWMRQPQGLLWVKGKPGSGKSTLMAFICNALQSLPTQRRVNLSFFFHGRGTRLQKTSEGMFRSILHQIYTRSRLARGAILRAFRDKLRSGGNGMEWEWQLKELQDLFLRVVSEVTKHREINIFVDAVDEAGAETAVSLVSYFHRLNDLVVAAGSLAKICISCRHYPVVGRSPGQTILVENENSWDISTFVHARLKDEVLPRRADPFFVHNLNNLGERMVSQAGSLFQWASLMIPKIVLSLNDGESFEDVNQMISEEPTELFAVYENIMKNVVNARNQERIILLMQWICLAERPLSVTELRFAMACDDDCVHPGQIRCEEGKGFVDSDSRMQMLINSLSGGLAEARFYATGSTVQFCHQTVNDFLLSDGLQFLHSVPGVENLSREEVIGSSQSRLSRCCINYLRLGEVQQRDRIWNKDVVYELPFIHYASTSLFLHAEHAERRGILQQNLVQKLNTPPQIFKTWVKSYNAVDSLGEKSPVRGSSLLHAAASSNLQSVVKFLLGEGVSVEEQDDHSRRALHYAARWGHKALTSLLLDAGADIEARDLSLHNALEFASSNSQEEVVKVLLERGSEVNPGTSYPHPLQAACMTGCISVVRILIANGADVNAQGGYPGTALQAAAYGCNQEVVQLLLDERAEINADGGFYGNALQAAAYSNKEDSEAIVRLLLDKGAQLNKRGGEYGNALQAAVCANSENPKKLVQFLLHRGAEVNAECGKYGNALQAAADQGGNMEIVQLLLDNGVDVNLEGGMFGSALQAAAHIGAKDVVQILLDRGAEINAAGGMYGSALQAASFSNAKEVVQLLLENGANVNAQGGEYGNALQAAAASTNKGIVQLLLDAGARVNEQGGEYGSALLAAVFFRQEGIIQLLLDAGAEVNQQGGEFGSALLMAVYSGHGRIVKQLLDNGADVNTYARVQDVFRYYDGPALGKYQTALQLAIFYRYDTLVKLLLDRGADPNVDTWPGNALTLAIINGNKATVELLLDAGADINAESEWFGTTIEASEGDYEMTNLLLDRGVAKIG